MTIKEVIDGIDWDDEYFVFDIADRIAERIVIDDTPESVDRLGRLPAGLRYIEPLIYYSNQVDNGGHHQYFWNSQGVYRELVKDGLVYYGVQPYTEIFQEALKSYRPGDYQCEEGGTWEGFTEAYSEKRFDSIDDRFFAADPDLADLIGVKVFNELYKNMQVE